MRKTITGTGGMLLVQTLKDAGVDYLFTNPGSAETGIFAALAETEDPRLVIGKHEGLVAAMADGYHRLSGKVGVVPMLAGDAGIAAIPGPWYNVVPSTSQHKDAAKKFIAFAIANNALGIEAPLGLAATNSAYRSYSGKSGYEHFAPLLETLSAPATQGRPINEKYQEIVDEAVLPAVQEALTCTADVAEVLKEDKETIEDILN